MLFQWDSRKARLNWANHAVSFSEATSVFSDSLAKVFADEAHSIDEQREVIIGRSLANRLLFVVFTEVEEGVLRLISARRATRREQLDYEDGSNI